jgi:hypothetical protein
LFLTYWNKEYNLFGPNCQIFDHAGMTFLLEVIIAWSMVFGFNGFGELINLLAFLSLLGNLYGRKSYKKLYFIFFHFFKCLRVQPAMTTFTITTNTSRNVLCPVDHVWHKESGSTEHFKVNVSWVFNLGEKDSISGHQYVLHFSVLSENVKITIRVKK